MAKVTKDSRNQYAQKIEEYKLEIEEIAKRQQRAEEAAHAAAENGRYHWLISANENLSLVSYFVLMNGVSVSLLGIKNEGHLNEARKRCYKCIIDLEKVVTPGIDVPYSDYADRLASIEAFADKSRLKLLRKLGFAIETLQEGYGINSKWRWSFVELHARYAAIAKNLINLKTFVAKMDPRIDGYEIRMAHLKLVKTLLHRAADRYREKYELSTHRADDMQLGISFLNALRRLFIMFGETTETEVTKRKIESWMTKLDSDAKKRKAAAKSKPKSPSS